MATEKPLIVIVGPTASGKTDLSIRLAKKLDGEIICADSRTIYRGMNIGTAKPTLAEMGGIRHHGIDLVYPNERFTLWDFQQLTKEKIKEIRDAGKVPFVVGGSGLYVDSVVFDYQMGDEEPDREYRKKLEKMSINDLIMMIKEQHLDLPANYKNPRHLIRTIERGNLRKNRLSSPIDNTIVVGISTEKSVLEDRIRSRSEQMLNNGLVDEVSGLLAKYGNIEPIRRNLYGEVQKFIQGDIANKTDLIEHMVIVDRQLVKKQLTWFKRNKYIEWVNLADAEDYVLDRVQNL